MNHRDETITNAPLRTVPALAGRIESLIQEEVGRNIGALCAAATGGLFGAATSLAVDTPSVGLITGFYVPRGEPPAAETDGPLGAALLAHGLRGAGIACRLATDEPCRTACVAVLEAAGLTDLPLDVAGREGDLPALIAGWREAGVTHALSIERCGRAADGVPRNMTGLDIGAWMVPLDALFTAGPWETIGIGDGGNELGMGALPAGLIAEHVANGAMIACATSARHLIVAGVSNWAAYGLLAVLALLRPDWRGAMMAALDETLHGAMLEAMVRRGPAVDGVTRRQELTVDSLSLDVHAAKLRAVRAALEGACGG